MSESTSQFPALPAHQPAVSVILPVYNGVKYVGAAVRSILDQTFTDFEFVIVDDGSTDGTSEILARLAGIDKRIQLIRQPNAGRIGAANRAATVATAPLLARMDGDDIAMPTRLARQVQYMREHPECAALGTRILAMDPDGIPTGEQFLLTSHEEIDQANLAGRCAIAQPSAMIRRSCLDRFPPYRTEYVEDLDLWLRLGERGRLANLPETLLHYRQHGGGSAFDAAYVNRSIMEQVLREADQRRGIQKVRPPLPADFDKPMSLDSARWLWCRAALGCGHYLSAWRLARKAAAAPFTPSRVVTLVLVALGPIGRAILQTWRAMSRSMT